MDKLEKYRKHLKSYLTQYVTIANRDDKLVKTQLFIDPTKDTYLVISYGWTAERFVHFVAFYLQLKAEDGTVWLYENRTNKSVVKGLSELGVAKDDIVLALVEPYREEKVTA